MNKLKDNQVVKEVEQIVDVVDKTVSSVLQHTDELVDPVRQSVFRRFPTLFILLVTFGVSATIYGFELLLSQWGLFADRPWLILGMGMLVLIGTGTLYRKLG